jgi:hypothetical protein
MAGAGKHKVKLSVSALSTIEREREETSVKQDSVKNR